MGWPSHCRSAPELDQLQARLSALMPFRVGAEVLVHMLPVDAGKSPETLRSHTLRVGQQLSDAVADQPAAAAAAINVSLDGTFIRSREDGEPPPGSPRWQRRDRRWRGHKAADFLIGFYIAMRMQHTARAASGLVTDNPDRVQAKAVIVVEVERLRWRIWNGKATNAQRSIVRIRKVMRVFRGERGHRTRGLSSGKLWSALHDVDSYLRGQGASLVNYAERYRADLRAGTSITEGTANFLVNRRMNKSQQMRWSRRGADLLLQVRCAVYNGTLGSGIGHRFEAFANPEPVFAMVA